MMKPLMNTLCGLWNTAQTNDTTDGPKSPHSLACTDVSVFCTSHLSPWSNLPSNLKQCCRWRFTSLTGSWGRRSSELLNLVSDGEGQLLLCCVCLRFRLKDGGLTPEQTVLGRCSRLLHTHTQPRRAENLSVLLSTSACFCAKREV